MIMSCRYCSGAPLAAALYYVSFWAGKGNYLKTPPDILFSLFLLRNHFLNQCTAICWIN